jgi:hypothetical protein
MRRTMLAVVAVLGILVADPGTAGAMTWNGGKSFSYEQDSFTCAFNNGLAGYLNPSRYHTTSFPTACWSNATTSTWDSNLASDYFVSSVAGTPSVTTTDWWRNQFSLRSYTIFSAVNCAGTAVSVGAGVTWYASITSRSIATPSYVPSCRA